MATRAENRLRIEKDAVRLIRFRYPNLGELALLPRNGNQVTSFQALEAWLGQVASELATQLDAIDATVDPDTGDGINIDTATLEAADPLLTWQDFVRL